MTPIADENGKSEKISVVLVSKLERTASRYNAASTKVRASWGSSSIRKSFGRKNTSGDVTETCPRIESVLLAFLFLFLFLVLSVVALRFPTTRIKWAVIGVSALFVAILGGVFVYDSLLAKDRRMREYSRNLVNTILTVMLTMTVMTAMYSQVWHKGLNDTVIHLETDTVSAPRFPAIAFFQRWQNSQAYIMAAELKCYSGPKDDGAAQCSTFSIPEAIDAQSCDCGDSWPSTERLERGGNTVEWLGRNATYYAMTPSLSTVSKGAGHFLTLQVFFNYNKTESFANESLTTAPGIWMAIYDPVLGIEDAIAGGTLYTAQIDANSHTVVNIGLKYYQYVSKRSNYNYDVTISVRQNLDLVCDVDVEGWYLCHLTLEVQIPSFLRTIVREENRYHWSSVVADAGAYFALVQFLSWIFSGSAWN
ncbi:hypothetical protein K458DRAFT_384198 [Lentithecium fluviatile CBS 122367]|uniref:Uncharacterized protein n=1 Tax=Lentithecium fluviatile CBS 122367 TaxID=1168545 RepID=A0A6G1JG66_9PLEO|nr:hypothetical protein K458DRAFT_384198 [Lentithecium fluviatile CBS 122367]